MVNVLTRLDIYFQRSKVNERKWILSWINNKNKKKNNNTLALREKDPLRCSDVSWWQNLLFGLQVLFALFYVVASSSAPCWFLKSRRDKRRLTNVHDSVPRHRTGKETALCFQLRSHKCFLVGWFYLCSTHKQGQTEGGSFDKGQKSLKGNFTESVLTSAEMEDSEIRTIKVKKQSGGSVNVFELERWWKTK